MNNKKTYNVGITKVYMSWINVEATSLAEARHLAKAGNGEIVETEYMWDYEEDEIQIRVGPDYTENIVNRVPDDCS